MLNFELMKIDMFFSSTIQNLKFNIQNFSPIWPSPIASLISSAVFELKPLIFLKSLHL